MNNISRGPDFLGIGAQKSATRWLYTQLKQHPNMYLTPVKELHYFDKLKDSTAYSERFGERVWKKNWKKIFSSKGGLDLAWKLKYSFGQYSDDWYGNLFKEAGDRIAGEITPEYSILPVERIHEIRNMYPDLKIIYLLRDPVARAWSHFRMHVNRSGLDFSEMKESEILKFLGSKNCFAKGNYYGNLQRWLEVFDSERIFIGYLDEVKKDPEDLLFRLLNHLDVETPSDFEFKKIEEPAHVGMKIPFGEKYKEFLQEKYRQHNEDLYALLKNPIIKSW